jgi:hypothetical protein
MDAAERPEGPSRTSDRMENRPRRRVLDGGHRHRPDEHIVLGAGVLASRLLQLPDQGVDEALKAGEFGRRQGDFEVIGRDQSVNPQPTPEVHFSREATADLHRMQLTPKGFGERAIDNALKAPFELLKSHAGHSLSVPTSQS